VVSVTPAEQDDLLAVAAVLEELDRYYGSQDEPPPLEQRVEQMKALLFRDQPAAYVLLARDDDRVVGLVTYSFQWPAVGITQSIFIKELYVLEAYRQRGIGRLLMQAVCRVAVEQGCSRVEWMADTDNPAALRFYNGLGVDPRPDKLVYRLDGEALIGAARH
jgi:GNAT superfamily N-acetyltransferase